MSPASRGEEGGLLNSPPSVPPFPVPCPRCCSLFEKHHYTIKAGYTRAMHTLVYVGCLFVSEEGHFLIEPMVENVSYTTTMDHKANCYKGYNMCRVSSLWKNHGNLGNTFSRPGKIMEFEKGYYNHIYSVLLVS